MLSLENIILSWCITTRVPANFAKIVRVICLRPTVRRNRFLESPSRCISYDRTYTCIVVRVERNTLRWFFRRYADDVLYYIIYRYRRRLESVYVLGTEIKSAFRRAPSSFPRDGNTYVRSVAGRLCVTDIT
jgi:hypothetical protein